VLSRAAALELAELLDPNAKKAEAQSEEVTEENEVTTSKADQNEEAEEEAA